MPELGGFQSPVVHTHFSADPQYKQKLRRKFSWETGYDESMADPRTVPVKPFYAEGSTASDESQERVYAHNSTNAKGFKIRRKPVSIDRVHPYSLYR
jgi:hypothetical protein